MASFAENQWFQVITCGGCGTAFAMTSAMYERRKNDHKSFWCPNGCERHFTGKSEADKLRDELAHEQAKSASKDIRIQTLAHERDTVTKAHRKMRMRVMNGVCPCCNRSFANLREHMRTQHADFGKANTLKALREAFGMTQADVAKEAFVNIAYVSKYEHDKPLPVEAKESLDFWVERQGAVAK